MLIGQRSTTTRPHAPGSYSLHDPTKAEIGDTKRFKLLLSHLLFVGMLFIFRFDREPVRHKVEQPIIDVGYAIHERRRTQDATSVLTWVRLQDRRCATNRTIRPTTFLKFGEASGSMGPLRAWRAKMSGKVITLRRRNGRSKA